MNITLINHGSVFIEVSKDFSLLTDPWYFGYAFADGWGLRYENNNWAESVEKAKYMWISQPCNEIVRFSTKI